MGWDEMHMNSRRFSSAASSLPPLLPLSTSSPSLLPSSSSSSAADWSLRCYKLRRRCHTRQTEWRHSPLYRPCLLVTALVSILSLAFILLPAPPDSSDSSSDYFVEIALPPPPPPSFSPLLPDSETPIRTKSAVEVEGKDPNEVRRDAVREALLHAWTGYAAHAFGHDEVSPVTNGTNDSWGAFGVTLVDALDTLHLAFHGWGGEEQKTAIAELWTRAEEHVRQIDWMVRDYDASFFEMTIRYLGGLLSIHQLSGERMYLPKAEELGERLALAFDSPSGVPYSIVNLRSGKTRNPQWNGGNSILSELGSVQDRKS